MIVKVFLGLPIKTELNSTEKARKNGVVTLGAPAGKRLALALVSLELSSLAMTTDALAACLVGGWTSAMMFRRPFMSILSRLHKDFDFSAVDQVAPKLLPLSRSSAQELVILAVLCPLICTDLGVPVVNEIFATDASEYGGAAVEAKIPVKVSRALCRTGRRKGGRARILSREEILLKRIDPLFEDDLADSFWESDGPPTVQRPLAFRYHFIEVCGGAGKVTKYVDELGFVVGPVIDLERSPAFDVALLEVISWLYHLVEHGLIDSWIIEPPCTTFSSAAHPALRSYKKPRGYVPTEARTLLGTKLALRALALMYLAAVCDVVGTLEQPLRSKMAWLAEWRRLLELELCHEETTDSCMFGSPHQKPFRFLVCNAESSRLKRRCDRSHVHVKIQGGYTKNSAVYCDGLARELALMITDGLVVKMRRQKCSELACDGLENPFVNDLLVGRPWQVTAKWRWKGSSHINILETATLAKLFKELAINRPSRRFAVAVDSNVAISAATKGRTSSDALRLTIRRLGATVVAGCLYPAYHFSPTRINPSDPPSRGRELDPPGSEIFQGISFEETMDLLEIPPLRRFAANWVRLMCGVLAGSLSWLGNQQDSWRFAHWKYKHYPFRYQIKGASASEAYVKVLQQAGLCARVPLCIRPDPSDLLDFDQTLGYPGEGPVGSCWWLWWTLLVMPRDSLDLPDMAQARRYRIQCRQPSDFDLDLDFVRDCYPLIDLHHQDIANCPEEAIGLAGSVSVQLSVAQVVCYDPRWLVFDFGFPVRSAPPGFFGLSWTFVASASKALLFLLPEILPFDFLHNTFVNFIIHAHGVLGPLWTSSVGHLRTFGEVLLGYDGLGISLVRAMDYAPVLLPRDKNEAKKAALRGILKLQERRPVTGKTQQGRDRLLQNFATWLEQRSVKLDDVVAPCGLEVERITSLLQAYGREICSRAAVWALQ